MVESINQEETERQQEAPGEGQQLQATEEADPATTR